MAIDMKDHELRELINDVTAVAKIYAHTQQLREQISHLITPVFAKMQTEIKAVEDRQLQCASAMRGEILLHEKQVMRQREEMIACLNDKNSLLSDIQAIHKLAELVADYNILSICNKAISNANGPDFADGHDCEGFIDGCERMGCPGGSGCTELPPTPTPSSDNNP